MEYSLLYPQNAERKSNTLTEESINDLSIDFILAALTDQKYEREHMRKLMVSVTDDPEVIRYRRDVFDDFLKFPKLREAMSELVLKLADLRDIERFQKDQESSSLWLLVNRLREIDDYVSCINMIKATLESLDIQSEGMLTLKQMVTDISRESNFDELKMDIDETLEKAKRLKSVTIGVNLDGLLRPRTAGVISLNDTKFTDAGLMRRFMSFADKKSGLHEGNDVSGFKQFHPANHREYKKGDGSSDRRTGSDNFSVEPSNITGDDALSEAIKRPVTEILRSTVNEIKFTLKRYINISGYSLTSLMPEIIFYVRWAELIDKIKAQGMPVCKAEILPPGQRDCSFKDLYNLKLAIKNVQGDNINIITNDIEFNDDYRIYILT